jgi:FkbM family methyltransferase
MRTAVAAGVLSALGFGSTAQADVTLGDTVFRVQGLVGVGRMDASLRDSFGETFGPGDWLIDVGSNIGFVALTGARAVGNGGRVIAFEPNPSLCARFRATLAGNDIHNVEHHELALGDVDGEALLAAGVQHGSGTLREGTGVRVRVGRADAILPAIPPGRRALVKIDVEGYELKVLRGMTRLIERPDTSFLVEVTDAWLRRTGGSAAELFALLAAHGYVASRPELDALSRLRLVPLDGPLPAFQYDVLFHRGALQPHPDLPTRAGWQAAHGTAPATARPRCTPAGPCLPR